MAGGVINTGSFPKALWPGIKSWWGRDYNEHPMEYRDLFEVQTSDMAYEELVQATGFGLAPVKPQGSATKFDSEQQGTISRFNNIAYALGYIVTWEEMRDNLYEKVARRRTRALAFSMRTTKEIVHANVYNRAFNDTFAGGDGVSLINTAHPNVAGNQSNALATPADLSEASLEDLMILISGFKNTRDLPIAVRSRSLIVPRQQWFEANRIMKSVLQNDTGNNAINVLKATNEMPEGIKLNHYLTDEDAYFVRTDCPDSLISFERDPIMFNEDNDGDTKNQKYMAYERYVPYWADWRGIAGSQGA
jgi:hypothetical protein